MANKTRAQMIDKVMHRLVVLALGQSASASQATLVGDVLDSVHSQYEKRGLAPFATSAFPDWAQEPFSKIFSADVGPYFGVRSIAGTSLSAIKKEGERELEEQMEKQRSHRPIEARYF